MAKIRFPDSFYFGAAASGPQTEGIAGRKGRHIWDVWFQKEPGAFHGGVGPSVASDFYHRYKEDIALMKSLNLDSYRHSIVWARLIPGGTGAVDPDAVSFYNDVFDEMNAAGVRPFVNLFHFDMPAELQEAGGWENRATVDAFVRYAEACFRLFGAKVGHWFTFNEPLSPPKDGYLEGIHYPKVRDLKRAVTVGYHVMLAHAGAVEAFRESGTAGAIGVILNQSPVYPRSDAPEDLRAGRIADLLFNRALLDPSIHGGYPEELSRFLKDEGLMPPVRDGDGPLFARSRVDLLGVNYYQPTRVMAPADQSAPGVRRYFDPYDMPGRKINPYRGWEIYEKGVHDLLLDLKRNHGNPRCFVSENGMGVENEQRFAVDGVIRDDYRIDFIRDHLRWIHKALEEGSACGGYHLWAFMDCWSWHNAYKNRYGLVSVDLATQRRTVKKSGEWFRELSRTKVLER